MTRTQISLPAERMAALRRLADERRVPIAALVREGVEHVLSKDARRVRHERALRAVGLGRDERDVAERHDEYPDKAYGR